MMSEGTYATNNKAIEKVNPKAASLSLGEMIKFRNRQAAQDQKSREHKHSENFAIGKATQGIDNAMLHRVAKSIASALNHLHTAMNPPILHMGVTPENILFTEEDTVMLTGFEKALYLYSDGLRDQQYLPFDFCTAPELHQQGGLPSRQSDMCYTNRISNYRNEHGKLDIRARRNDE